MSRRAKWTWVVVGIVVIVFVVGAAVAGKRNKIVEVRIEPVQRRDLVASVTASGQVEPHNHADLSADISGRIVQLAVKEGDLVKKGQFLMQIDPSTYQAAVERAQAALAAARAQAAQSEASLIQAQHAYQRSASIKQSNATLISDEQLEQLKTQSDVAKAVKEAADYNVAQAVASVSDAQSSLAKTTIRAPMTGRVTRLLVRQGETAIEGTFNKDAATLMTISDMSTLESKIKVDETDVAHIAVGDSAVIQLDPFPDTTFVGRVTQIDISSIQGNSAPTAASTDNDQAVDYEVTVRLLNPPRDTRPDFTATARIITDTRTHVLSIPIVALTVREHEALPSADTAVTIGHAHATTRRVGQHDVEGVFVVGADQKVAFRPVKVGIAGDNYFEVLNGLQGNERIVAGTYQAIRDLKEGTTVKAMKDTTTVGS